MFMFNRISAWLYDTTFEWIIRYIVVVYTVEIMIIAVLCTYGIMCEKGFRACGY